MNKIKKFISICLIGIMTISNVTPVLAEEDYSNVEIINAGQVENVQSNNDENNENNESNEGGSILDLPFLRGSYKTGKLVGEPNNGYASMDNGDIAFCIQEDRTFIDNDAKYTKEELDNGYDFTSVFNAIYKAKKSGFDEDKLYRIAQMAVWSKIGDSRIEDVRFLYGTEGVIVFNDMLDTDEEEFETSVWYYVPKDDKYQILVSGTAIAKSDIHVHTLGQPVKENEDAATCKKEGSFDEVVYCSSCGEELSREKKVVGKLDHVPGEAKKENYVQASCEIGESYDNVIRCKNCGDIINSTPFEGQALGHKWNDGTITTAATCEEAGVKTFTCDRCQATKTEAISATGHKVGDWVIEKEATCEEEGKKVKRCETCKAVVEEEIVNKLQHMANMPVKENETVASCEHDGFYEMVTYCSKCGTELSRSGVSVPMTGHKWDNGKVTKEATCTVDGVRTFTCSKCQATRTEVIKAEGHKPGQWEVTKEPTCEDPGVKVIKCTVCKEILESDDVPPKGHDYVEGECTECHDKLEDLNVIASGYEGVYDSKMHSISVSCEDATITYSTDGNSYSDTKPEYKNVGTYTIYYKVSKDKYKTVTGSKQVVITKANSGLTTMPSAKSSLTYNGKDQELINKGEVASGTIMYKVGDGTYSTTIPTGKDAGTYTVYYKVIGDVNHSDTEEKSITVTINKADGFINTKPVAKTLSCTGSEQELVTAGSNASGTIMYKLDNGTYSTSVPKAKNAGSYDVYYEIEESKNYKAVNESKIVVTISHIEGDPVRENEVAATYFADGYYDEVIYCSKCNSLISRTRKTIPQLEPIETTLNDASLRQLGYTFDKNNWVEGDYYSSVYSAGATGRISQWGYKLLKNGYEVTYLDIPSTYTYDNKKYKITKVNADCFAHCGHITNIIIPNTVTEIDGSFTRMTSLRSFNIPASVVKINSHFGAGGGTINYTVDDEWKYHYVEDKWEPTNYNINNMKSSLFSDCPNLTSLTVDPANTKYDSRNNCNAIIEKDTNILISGCNNTVIPNGVTEIACDAFNSQMYMTSMYIPSSVTKIWHDSFNNCVNLKTVSIPDNVTIIGNDAFSGCVNLTSVTLPSKLTYLGSWAFAQDGKLSSQIVIPSGVTSILDCTFRGCGQVTSVVLHDGIVSLGNDSLGGCQLAHLTLPKNIKFIDNWAIRGTMTSISLPSSLKFIGYCALNNCYNLQYVTYKGVTYTDKTTFNNMCKNTGLSYDRHQNYYADVW